MRFDKLNRQINFLFKATRAGSLFRSNFLYVYLCRGDAANFYKYSGEKIMTTEQIEIVKENFNLIAPLADMVASEFYKHLFQLDASLRPLFKEDLTGQKKKLMMMLNFAVGTLDRMDVFEPKLEELGLKHVAYGVKETHYETVGNALILTLRAMLGAALTEHLEAAWIAAYTLIAGTMQRTAYQAQAQAAG